MRAFADFRLTWAGKNYTIPARKIMPLLAQIEGVITFKELHEFGLRQTIPQAKLATAYALVLRYVGIEIEDDDIYLAMWPSQEDPDGKYAQLVHECMQNLMKLMLPPDKFKAVMGNVEAPIEKLAE